MRITILALGSRGDVQPYIALGLGLQAAGHTVRVAAATDYASLIAAYGLPFTPLVGSINALMDRELVYDTFDAGRNPLGWARRLFAAINPLVVQLLRDTVRACDDADALIATTLGLYCGLEIAQTRGIPLIAAHIHPYTVTRAYPHLFFPALPSWLPLQGAYNRSTYSPADHGFWQLLRGPLNRARREVLGLPPYSMIKLWQRVRKIRYPVVYGYSAHVAPPPSDWARELQPTGYWFLPQSATWQPPANLLAFLAAGPPPVYVGFGSVLAGRDPDAVTALIVEALTMAGQRGIIYSGWGDVGNIALPPTIYKLDGAPHAWLFPQLVAVVHHGGAGTTAAAIRAGIPSVVVPFFGDQRLWAERVRSMGLGPAPIPRPQLTVDRLAHAIKQAVGDAAMRERVATLGKQVRAEDGVARAVEVINHYLHYNTNRSS